MSIQGWRQRICNLWAPLWRHDIGTVDYIVVGIGNPGARYATTRHNIGFLVIDGLSVFLQEREVRRSRYAAFMAGRLGEGKRIACAKPRTYVNRTGLAVRNLIDMYSGSPSGCIVVVDDFNLELGRLRIRRGGSDGGHKGLKSIAAEIGTEFPRLRVGIGPVPDAVSSIDFVLGEFSREEKERKDIAVARAVDAVRCCCERGIDTAMNMFNR